MIFYKIFRFAALLFRSIKTFLLQRKSICFAFVKDLYTLTFLFEWDNEAYMLKAKCAKNVLKH